MKVGIMSSNELVWPIDPPSGVERSLRRDATRPASQDGHRVASQPRPALPAASLDLNRQMHHDICTYTAAFTIQAIMNARVIIKLSKPTNEAASAVDVMPPSQRSSQRSPQRMSSHSWYSCSRASATKLAFLPLAVRSMESEAPCSQNARQCFWASPQCFCRTGALFCLRWLR